jgi:hypothetical protein
MKFKSISYENEEIANEYKEQKYYKLIILIIASHGEGQTHYDLFKKCWEEYMNRFPEVKCFFLYSDENIESDILVNKNSITHKSKESLVPGILHKTNAGKYFCHKKFKYDYLLRTNLSSFIHIPNLLKYLETKERNQIWITNLEIMALINDDNMTAYDEILAKLKSENENNIIPEYTIENWKKYTNALRKYYNIENIEMNKVFHFLSGSFYILTSDLIKEYLYKIITDDEFIDNVITTIPDDVAISAILQKNSTQLSNNFRCYNTVNVSKICYELETEYKDDLVHIRNRTDMYYGNRLLDMKNMLNQIKKFYNPNFEA